MRIDSIERTRRAHADRRAPHRARTPPGRVLMARMVRKGDLPTKVCAQCGRPFAWRRKWARDWEAVKFCSKACAGAARKSKSTA